MKIVDKFAVEVEMEQSMSSIAKKSSSEYYELKLQVRLLYFNDIMQGKKLVYDKVVDNVKGVNKVEEVDNGFDFYLRSYGEMNKIPVLFTKDFLVTEKRSKKLIGRDNLVSKDKYRYTQSIILVNLKKGDKIKLKGKEYKIKAINKNSLVLLEAETGKKEVVTYSIIKEYLEVLDK